MFASCQGKKDIKSYEVFLFILIFTSEKEEKQTVNECPCSKTRKTYTGTVNMIYKFSIQSQRDTRVRFVFLQNKYILLNAQSPKHSSESKEQDEP